MSSYKAHRPNPEETLEEILHSIVSRYMSCVVPAGRLNRSSRTLERLWRLR